MRIVLDTNVWVSALISPAGTPAALMPKLEDHVLITSVDMLEEVQRILWYKRIADRYNVTPGMAKEYVENIRASAVLVAANLPDISNCGSRSLRRYVSCMRRQRKGGLYRFWRPPPATPRRLSGHPNSVRGDIIGIFQF